MCGIAGVVSRDGFCDRAVVRAMQSAIAHRGPDGEGWYEAGGVCIAHRRLAIIDPGAGKQPLFNEVKSLALVANGEIYNEPELRRGLTARGHRFRSESDCEVIAHLYEELGLECLRELRGMFAFALWDETRQRLILARDRMGEKPLYLLERDGQLLFCSELRGLLAGGVGEWELDPAAVHAYFHFGYIPEPETALRGVRKLSPGHVLVVSLHPWRIVEHCYWRMEDAPPLTGNPTQLIRAELELVSQLMLRADRPIGVALSGGLDSSAIAALSVRASNKPLHAFSVGYPGRPAYDERASAQRLADQLGLQFHDCELTTKKMVADFPLLNLRRDDPIADISGQGYYALAARAAEEGVLVLLQGQGGDELFWGYSWVREAAVDANGTFMYERVPHFMEARSAWRSVVSHEYAEQVRENEIWSEWNSRGQDNHQPVTVTSLIADLYLKENGIAQGDRLSMASSVEMRLPFVDHRLIETVIGLRKVRDDSRLNAKAWLKSALEGLLPDDVLQRPKQGFAPPLGTWHRALFAAYGDTLNDGVLVNDGVIQREAAKELAGGPFAAGVVVPMSFKALVLETWAREMKSVWSNARRNRLKDENARRPICV